MSELNIRIYILDNNENLIEEKQIDGIFNDIFSTLDKSNIEELRKIGFIKKKKKRLISDFLPESNHNIMIERGYTAEETPDFFKPYKVIDLEKFIEFYKDFLHCLTNYNDNIKFIDNFSRSYNIEQVSKLIDVFEFCLINKFKCNFTGYVA